MGLEKPLVRVHLLKPSNVAQSFAPPSSGRYASMVSIISNALPGRSDHRPMQACPAAASGVWGGSMARGRHPSAPGTQAAMAVDHGIRRSQTLLLVQCHRRKKIRNRCPRYRPASSPASTSKSKFSMIMSAASLTLVIRQRMVKVPVAGVTWRCRTGIAAQIAKFQVLLAVAGRIRRRRPASRRAAGQFPAGRKRA
jgi:hypothetical protein